MRLHGIFASPLAPSPLRNEGNPVARLPLSACGEGEAGEARAPGGICTHDRQLRKLLLYSAELQARCGPLAGIEPAFHTLRMGDAPAGTEWLAQDSNLNCGGFKPLPSANWGSEPSSSLLRIRT